MYVWYPNRENEAVGCETGSKIQTLWLKYSSKADCTEILNEKLNLMDVFNTNLVQELCSCI